MSAPQSQPKDEISTQKEAPKVEKKPPTEQEIIKGYNDTKQKYSLFFQKTLEIEQELVEHNLVASTIKELSGERRCFRKIGGVLVEKNLESIKKDLDVEIQNIKQTLDVVYKSMKQEEDTLIAFEKRYGDILTSVRTNKVDNKENKENKNASGVLV